MRDQADIQQMILFGACDVGLRVMRQIGEDQVYAFCDNYKSGEIIEGKQIIDIHTLSELNRSGKYKVMICVMAPHIACEIAQQLEERGIKYELCEECKSRCEWDMMHIVDGDVVYLSDTACSQSRKEKWYPLFMQMFTEFRMAFSEKKQIFGFI